MQDGCRRRKLAVVRRKFPLIWFLAPFVGGQFAALSDLPPGSIGVISVGPVLWLICENRGRATSSCFRGGFRTLLPVGAAVLAGYISFQVVLPVRSEVPGGEFFLMKVSESIRHYRAGEVVVPVQVYRAFEKFDGGELQRGARYLGEAKCRAVALPWRNVTGARPGDWIAVKAKFYESSPRSLRQRLSQRRYIGRCKILYSSRAVSPVKSAVQDLRERLKIRARSVLGNNESSGMILAMSLGMRDQLSRRTEHAFRKMGLSHVLVVSGYHLGLVYAVATLLFGLFLRRSRWFFAWKCAPTVFRCINLLLLAAYVALSGCGNSAVRAFLAAAFLLPTLHRSAERGFVHCSTVALFLLMVAECGSIFQPGIQLTFAALGGIAIAIRSTDKARSALRVCFFVWMATTAVSVLWFREVSWLAPLLNFTVAPLLLLLGTAMGLPALLGGEFLGRWGETFLWFVSSLLDRLRTVLVGLAGHVPYMQFREESFWPLVISTCCVILLVVMVRKNLRMYLWRMYGLP